jgi:hypothetical protein
VYRWATRHTLIAQLIAWYKYQDQDKLYHLLERVIDNLNSAMLLDREMVPSLCDHAYGIGRVVDPQRRIRLYEKLTDHGINRVPWHRLISTHLDVGDLDAVAQTIKRAERAVHLDSPIARYKVLLSLRRAEEMHKVLDTDDFVAFLLEAEDFAYEALDRWPDNKYSYRTLGDVASVRHTLTGDVGLVETVRNLFTDAYDRLLDDDLIKWRGELGRHLS